MKTTKLISCLFGMSAILVMFACGSTKPVVDTSTDKGSITPQKANSEVAIQETRSEQLAYEKPATRAWGEAFASRVSNASLLAQGQARASLALAIKAQITVGTDDNSAAYDKSNGLGQMGNDGMAKVNTAVSQVTEQLVQNTSVIHSDKFMTADGRYHVYVCLEYLPGVADMAQKIAKGVEDQISKDDKLKMNFEFEQYKKSIEEKLEKMRANNK